MGTRLNQISSVIMPRPADVPSSKAVIFDAGDLARLDR